MSRRTADYGRSARILNSALDYSQAGGTDREFADVVIGSMLEQGFREDDGDYPPEGHDYPRKGR